MYGSASNSSAPNYNYGSLYQILGLLGNLLVVSPMKGLIWSMRVLFCYLCPNLSFGSILRVSGPITLEVLNPKTSLSVSMGLTNWAWVALVFATSSSPLYSTSLFSL